MDRGTGLVAENEKREQKRPRGRPPIDLRTELRKRDTVLLLIAERLNVPRGLVVDALGYDPEEEAESDPEEPSQGIW